MNCALYAVTSALKARIKPEVNNKICKKLKLVPAQHQERLLH